MAICRTKLRFVLGMVTLIILGFGVFLRFDKRLERSEAAGKAAKGAVVYRLTPIPAAASSAELADRTPDLKALLHASPQFVRFRDDIFATEKRAAKYISSRRGRGRELIFILPPSEKERGEQKFKEELARIIEDVIIGKQLSVTTEAKDRILASELKWLSPSQFYKVGTIWFEGDVENPQGIVRYIEDPNQITDKIQYVDYGEINDSKLMDGIELLDRYGHLYKSEWTQ
jgi:hypothetical protein